MVCLFLLFNQGYTVAQCNNNEVEIVVEITTDMYGEETYWTLTDLVGNIVMQEGQGGTYGGSETFSKSVCIAQGACVFFDIFDTYGDGIFDPGGYKLYVNGVLASDGNNEFGSKASAILNCPNPCSTTLASMTDFHDHINGTKNLTANELNVVKNTFIRFPECLSGSESLIVLAKNIVQDYDTKVGPLFTTSNTLGGFSKNIDESPGLDVERTMLAFQQGLFDYVFSSEVNGLYPELINGWKFDMCSNFPGSVAAASNPLKVNKVLVRANFEDPKGMNPFYDINFEGMPHALRPTGIYLSPGSVVSVTVPDSLVGKDFWIRVGSHDWDHTERPIYYRLDRISKRFAIDSTTIEVFNPMGGAISLLVPYGANEGNVEISLTNGVEAPFFSMKSFSVTQNFDAELDKPGPWAIFESDNVMFTIPKHSIVLGQFDLKQVMVDWENALRGVNSIIAREITPDKHTMYMIADLDIRTGVYSIGYPMSNTPINYSDVPGNPYFLNGPGPDDEVNFHEAGHSWRISKFPGEEEAFVNFPYVMALNYGLNEDLNEAVKYSFVPNTFDVDKTVTHRLVSNTFGAERDLSNTEMDEVRYQHRGYGHYFEIVNILGWCPLRNLWAQEFIDFNNGIDYVAFDNIDSRIIRMSIAAQADLRPLFHVFGVVPLEPDFVQDTLTQLGIKHSSAIYNRLQDYIDLVPKNNAEFIEYAKSVYPNLDNDGPTENPNYGVGWHYLKSLSYNEAEAQDRISKLQAIINLYYTNGAPSDSDIVDVCCKIDTLSVNVVDDEVIVTGGVEPYEISSSVVENVKTVTVVDYDGCEATFKSPLTSLYDESKTGLKVYPNPASTAINVELTDLSKSISDMKLVGINGRIISKFDNSLRVIDISPLNDGVYILQIKMADGTNINKRVIILSPK